MADNKRYLCAAEALRKYGADITKEQLLRAYEQGGVLPREMRRNLKYGIQQDYAAFDLKDKNAPAVLDDAPLWASVFAHDAKAAMRASGMDAAVDGDAFTVENARYLAAALVQRYGGHSVRDSLFEAAEMVPEEGRTAKLVVEAKLLCDSDPEHALERMQWRYGAENTAHGRLAALVTALLLEKDNGDALYAAFYAEKPSVALGNEQDVLPERRLSVELLGPAYLIPGKARACMLTIHNDSDKKMLSALRSECDGTISAMTAAFTTVDAHKSVTIPYTAWLPEETDTICERNVLYARYAGMEVRFGIAGAQGWRVRGKKHGGQFGAWEVYWSEGNRIPLDSLNGCGGAYEFEMERMLVLRENVECAVNITHTCAFALEADGKPVMHCEATDGWDRNETKTPLKLEKGEHELRITLTRSMPGGFIQLDFLKDGELMAMEAVNPLKGL